MSGIPRSASVIARGQSGKEGHTIAVMFSGSTYLGSCKNNQTKVRLCLIINRTVNEPKKEKINQTKKQETAEKNQFTMTNIMVISEQ